MATNFLQATGASTTGFFNGTTVLISSELVALASSGTATSVSVYTSSASFGQAIWGDAWVYATSAITPASGGFLSCWWLKSKDGGTTFEKTTASLPLARSPDFIIPMSSVAYASSDVSFSGGIVKMPWPAAKLFVQNNTGVTFFASNSASYPQIGIGPVAVQY